MPLFYALTLFVSAFLLFLIQPMVGKMLLPLMGGTPMVWSTCMVFFQAMLLGGYLYSHLTTTKLDTRRQTLVHAGLMLVTLLAMAAVALFAGKPINVSTSLAPQGSNFPAPQVLLVLFLAVGLPFFTVASSAPLLQKWFAGTGHPAAKDPYFLYGASNLGSVLAMFAYPLLLEPRLRVASQSWTWAAGFVVLFGLTSVCAWRLWRVPAAVRDGETVYAPPADDAAATPWPRRLRWLALAFIPSSLMLGVTTYIATDIASLPLLWIIPLGLYLVTFIIAFSRTPKGFHTVLALTTPVAILLLVFVHLSEIEISLTLKFAVHLAAFFMVALTCHNELARSRPPTRRLTEFYLIMSIGGVLGGAFNALVAPALFNDVHEYKIALFAACLALPALKEQKFRTRDVGFDFALVAGLAVVAVLLAVQVFRDPKYAWSEYSPLIARWRQPVSDFSYAVARGVFRVTGWFGTGWSVGPQSVFKVIAFGFPALACYVFVERPVRFAMCVGALLLAGYVNERVRESPVIVQIRSPFGVLRVHQDRYDQGRYVYHKLVHGTTIHGLQQIVPEEEFPSPLTYYHQAGPVGHIFDWLPVAWGAPNIAAIGLGTGSLATYCDPGQSITFFEIDPAVQRIAEDPAYFTFLKNCRDRGGHCDVVLGDARVQLERRRNDRYGLILVDAFSSDSIPVHLLTREALRLYLDRLEPGGVIALHISNRYLSLQKVVRRLAAEAGLAARSCIDGENKDIEKSATHWVVLARRDADFGPLRDLIEVPDRWDDDYDLPPRERPTGRGLAAGGVLSLMARDRWKPMTVEPNDPLWTDDFSNLIKILKR